MAPDPSLLASVPLIEDGTGATGGPPPPGGTWAGTGWVRGTGHIRAAGYTPAQAVETTATASGDVAIVVHISAAPGGSDMGVRLGQAPSGDAAYIWLTGGGDWGAESTAGGGTWLGGGSGLTVSGLWLAVARHSAGVAIWRSADGTTWTTMVDSSFTGLTGTLLGELFSSSADFRVDRVRFGALGGPPPPSAPPTRTLLGVGV